MGIYVALLRGINVGKSTRIAMRDLTAMFTDAGCRDVASYVQSGNVVFAANAALAERMPDLIARRIADEIGVTTWIIRRDITQMRRIVANNPFAHLDAPPTSVAVAFVRKEGDVPAFAYTGNLADIPDRVEVVGGEIYLYLPNGFSKSTFDPKFFSKDLAETTTRNWRSVTKLLAMMEALA